MLSEIKQKLLLQPRLHRYRILISALGVRGAIQYILYPQFKFGLSYRIHPRQSLYPLDVRRGSSDLEVFHQIFADREYACLENLSDVRLVVDCGANVGYSSAYFLSQFPDCQVIAIEPDPDNFTLLQHNVAEYGDRVQTIQAAVWSHSARLVISKEPYRDGREWTKQVQLCGPDDEADIEGMDVGAILACSGYHRISILKVDVEGAEAVVFKENYQSWLPKVDVIVIELHDDSTFGKASDVFFAAISGQGFHISEVGDITICRR